MRRVHCKLVQLAALLVPPYEQAPANGTEYKDPFLPPRNWADPNDLRPSQKADLLLLAFIRRDLYLRAVDEAYGALFNEGMEEDLATVPTQVKRAARTAHLSATSPRSDVPGRLFWDNGACLTDPRSAVHALALTDGGCLGMRDADATIGTNRAQLADGTVGVDLGPGYVGWGYVRACYAELGYIEPAAHVALGIDRMACGSHRPGQAHPAAGAVTGQTAQKHRVSGAVPSERCPRPWNGARSAHASHTCRTRRAAAPRARTRQRAGSGDSRLAGLCTLAVSLLLAPLFVVLAAPRAVPADHGLQAERLERGVQNIVAAAIVDRASTPAGLAVPRAERGADSGALSASGPGEISPSGDAAPLVEHCDQIAKFRALLGTVDAARAAEPQAQDPTDVVGVWHIEPAPPLNVTANIEDVEASGTVLALDEGTDTLAQCEVVQTFVRTGYELRVLEIAGPDDAIKTIRTTEEHRFYLAIERKLHPASERRPRHALLAPDGGILYIAGTRRESHPAGIAFYNFEVAGAHGYFVSQSPSARSSSAQPQLSQAAKNLRRLPKDVLTGRTPTRHGRTILAPLYELGRPTGVCATIVQKMIGTGRSAAQGIRPPVFTGAGARHFRGHLLAKQLGSFGRNPRNLVTGFQKAANSWVKGAIALAVRPGEIVDDWAISIYVGSRPIRIDVTIREQGRDGISLHLCIINRGG